MYTNVVKKNFKSISLRFWTCKVKNHVRQYDYIHGLDGRHAEQWDYKGLRVYITTKSKVSLELLGFIYSFESVRLVMIDRLRVYKRKL